MNNDINLVKKNVDGADNRKTKILRNGAIAFALLIAILSIILFVLSRRNSLESIKKEQNTVLQNITFLEEKAAKFDLINDRIRNIEKVLDARKNYIETVNTIIQEVPNDASVVFVSIDKGVILMTISSASLLSINEFLDRFIGIAEEKHVIKDTTIESLTINSQSERYLLSIKAKLL